ncbi:MAG: hypothetical protein V4858_05775 [Pseudomonadota bacterium]
MPDNSAMGQPLLKTMLLASALLYGVALWRSDALPSPAELASALQDEPVQTPVRQAAYVTTSHGVDYTVQPLHEYELVGLVVSKHDTHTWWDYLHREWNDSLNIVDLCVIWGSNARSGAYADIDFSSGQFTCNFSTRSDAAFAAFDQTAISNNHLLTDQPALAKKLRTVRVGDQVRFRGHLAEYSHQQGMNFKRGTSTVRTDSGNGACETVFLESIEIIKTGGKPWRVLVWLAGLALLLSVIAWFASPVRRSS